MNAQHSQRKRPWWRIAFGVAIVLAVTLIASPGYTAWEYTTWRNKMIQCDYGTIDRLCGGDTARIYYLELEPHDRILLCTDGLSDMVSDEEIAIELGKQLKAQAACDRLIQRALENGGRDNVTAVLASAQSHVR